MLHILQGLQSVLLHHPQIGHSPRMLVPLPSLWTRSIEGQMVGKEGGEDTLGWPLKLLCIS